MESIVLENPLEKLLKINETKKPKKVLIHGQEFIVLPNLPELLLKELELFLEDRLDKFDPELNKEIQEARQQIKKGDYLSHDEIWQGIR